MNKVILVDGNNLLYRSFYATMYTGNLMKTSSGEFTNAVYGFVNMMNKIITEEKPEHIMVAFDKGKTFRHDKYESYKAGRQEMPHELRPQFPLAKEILKAMGIHYYEIDNYEADDIIGSACQLIEADPNYSATIVSSDKDLLQLISDDVEIKLLKQKDYIRYTPDLFIKDYGFKPIHIIDLKALQGDASDNIKGVKGIGEKTALKLISEYHTVENLYEHIDEIKGAMQTKLIEDKANAFESKELCTIYKDIELPFSIEDMKYDGPNLKTLNELYQRLEFHSLLKNINYQPVDNISFEYLEDLSKLKFSDTYALYFEYDQKNYHDANIIAVGYADQKHKYVFSYENFINNLDLFKGNIITFNAKAMYVKYPDTFKLNITHDIMLMGYLNNYPIKDDISSLAGSIGVNLCSYHKKHTIEECRENVAKKAEFIFTEYNEQLEQIKFNNLESLYYDMELPLTKVLAKMEISGVTVSLDILNEISDDLTKRVNDLEQNIYNIVGHEFNIASPKQLGDILFDELNLPGAKKTKTGYSTDKDVLHRLLGTHLVIEPLLEHRALTKVKSTYAEGLKSYVHDDNKIHPIFNQTLTRTGRLSCMEPNLQNIPIRNEEGRIIRKAFVASDDHILLGCDYSQIELRIFAHLSKVPSLMEAFNKGMDIHTKTAMDIFHIQEKEVTSEERRIAKAVNFGIIYGISGFGLSNNLDIDVKEAKQFIDKYMETFPGVKDYMNTLISDAKVEGFVKTMYGRIRKIEELGSNNFMIRSMGERMALNTPVQGTSADIIKAAMIKIDEAFIKQKLTSKMIIQVHDELIFDVEKSELEQVQKIVKDIMENIIKLDVPLVVDMNTGTNWYLVK